MKVLNVIWVLLKLLFIRCEWLLVNNFFGEIFGVVVLGVLFSVLVVVVCVLVNGLFGLLWVRFGFLIWVMVILVLLFVVFRLLVI